MSGAKLKKAEQRWRWLAGQLWSAGFIGWTAAHRARTKVDTAILLKRVDMGHAEFAGGLVRLTPAGRAALQQKDESP